MPAFCVRAHAVCVRACVCVFGTVLVSVISACVCQCVANSTCCPLCIREIRSLVWLCLPVCGAVTLRPSVRSDPGEASL